MKHITFENDVISFFFSLTDGEDFTAMTVQLTILASESEACADVPITDDELALEGDELFEITLTTPPDIPSSPDPSTVTIIDDDGA